MQIIFSHSRVPAFNLSAEEYLFPKLGEDFLLLYINNPSIIIGSNQAVLNEVDQNFCIEHGIRVVRRLSGGGAVYHDTGNLNYSFIIDKTEAPLSHRFLDPVVEVLHRMGIPAEIRKRKDLWLDGYKVSGTASHVSRGRELHHGTLLYDTDLQILRRSLDAQNRSLIKKATASVPSPVKNIRSFLNDKTGVTVEPEQFFQQFARQMAQQLGVKEIGAFQEEEIAEIEELQKNKYTQRDWNYRM